MTSTFALLTTHPELVRCQLMRLEEQVNLAGPPPFDEVGVGSFAGDDLLLRRLSRSAAPQRLSDLFAGGGTEALIVQARALAPGRAVEADTQPLRFRHWLFALEGSVPQFQRLRQALEASLPEYLRRHVQVDTEGEAAFALFLEGLRELGRTDDRSLEAGRAAQLAGRAARRLSRLSAEAGASRTSSFSFVASNARTLVAARLGSEPLFYTLLEGAQTCASCGVTPESPELNPLVRAHRRCRTVAVATHVSGDRWIELPPGQALSVNDRAELKVEAF